MEETLENPALKAQTETLEIEVKKFADELPYWSKFIAEKILTGQVVSPEDIDSCYSYLLEDLKLQPNTIKPDILINYNQANAGNYKADLVLTKIENVEGVNALTENQTLEFSQKLTIIYGANGSGKSGYVRLLKQSYYSKAPEDILPNIYLADGHKTVSAQFTYSTGGTSIMLAYPEKKHSPEFEQYAVFDGKSVIRHLDQKNEFEFRPAGLSFFSEYSEVIKDVEVKLNEDILSKKAGYSLDDMLGLFEGDSEVKAAIQSLSADTKIDDLKLYLPFSEEDKASRVEIEKQYDDLLLASKSKEKEIQALENIKRLLDDNRKTIEIINQYFNAEYLAQIREAISASVIKDEIAKAEGVENFQMDKIKGIGTIEWKNFIVAAERFANIQKDSDLSYPEDEDNCLLCNQSLSEEAQQLILKYWDLIKSVAEDNVKKAGEALNKAKEGFEKLDLNLLPEDNVLATWLKEKYPQLLSTIIQNLSDQKNLATNIISDLASKKANERSEIQIDTSSYKEIEEGIDTSVKLFTEGEQSKELERLLKDKTKLIHREKLALHFQKIESYVSNEAWIKNAGKANFAKRKITDVEKVLSDKYFNQKYVETFNEECAKLNGNFGIEVSHTGSSGKSFRQLKLKGRNPHAILSEGEQKVIAIADFISEMKLSDINRGIIFDDPVTSLDDKRKSEIAERLVQEALNKQVIIFTHDLVFVSSIMGYCKQFGADNDCHWIENIDGTQPGKIWLKNTPSFEKDYKTSGKAQKYYDEAKAAAPQLREDKIKNGFAALRTSYETQVVFGLFKGVVQRFEERVSVDSLSSVCFTPEIRDDLLDSFYQCCRYMEGHSHSDKYAYKKPELENLNEEIQRFNTIKQKIKALKA
jgi:energy-coupling factor transporter ATP-binding protein EcfA2